MGKHLVSGNINMSRIKSEREIRYLFLLADDYRMSIKTEHYLDGVELKRACFVPSM